MNRLTSLGRILFACLLIALPSSIVAQHFFFMPVDEEERPGRCDSEVFCDALYWAPNSLEFNYAETGNIEPPGLFQFDAVTEDLLTHLLDPGYNWGFRIGYRMNQDRWFTQMEFLWIEMENSATATRGPNDNTMSIPLLELYAPHATGFNSAFGDSNTQYCNASLQVGVKGTDTCRGFYETYGAAEAIYYRFRMHVQGEGEAMFVDPDDISLPIRGEYSQQADMVGLGLGAGFRALGNLGCGFSVGGMVQAFATVSRVTIAVNSNALTPALNFEPPPDVYYEDSFIPTKLDARACFTLGFKGRVNLNYERRICAYNVNGQIGFEANVYKLGFVGGPIIRLGTTY
jgi:hypothetical protein